MAYNESTLLEEILTILRALDNYSANNCKIGDTKVLDYGDPRAIIIREGEFSSGQDEEYRYMGASITIYDVLIQVFRKYQADGETESNLRADVKDVREAVDAYHRLNDHAQMSKVISGSAPFDVFSTDGSGPYFLMRELTARITVLEEPTWSD